MPSSDPPAQPHSWAMSSSSKRLGAAVFMQLVVAVVGGFLLRSLSQNSFAVNVERKTMLFVNGSTVTGPYPHLTTTYQPFWARLFTALLAPCLSLAGPHNECSHLTDLLMMCSFLSLPASKTVSDRSEDFWRVVLPPFIHPMQTTLPLITFSLITPILLVLVVSSMIWVFLYRQKTATSLILTLTSKWMGRLPLVYPLFICISCGLMAVNIKDRDVDVGVSESGESVTAQVTLFIASEALDGAYTYFYLILLLQVEIISV